jgi:hypothetical protein
MGQLQLYQWALEEQEPERQLFLAISQAIYTRHFQKPIAILNQLKESRRVHEGVAGMHRFPPQRKVHSVCHSMHPTVLTNHIGLLYFPTRAKAK